MSHLITLTDEAIEALPQAALDRMVTTLFDADGGPSAYLPAGGSDDAGFQQRRRVAELCDSGLDVRAALRMCPGADVSYSRMCDMLAKRRTFGDRALRRYGIRKPRRSKVCEPMRRAVRRKLDEGFGITQIRRLDDIVKLSREHGPVPTRDQIRLIRDRKPVTVGVNAPGSQFLTTESSGSVSRAFYGGRPLARVEADGTTLDLRCQTDRGSTLTLRPRNLLATDISTHMPAAINLLPKDADQHDVHDLVTGIVLPKEPLLKELGIRGVWPIHGIMDQLYVDRGKVFIARSQIRLTWRLGYVLVVVGAGMPHRKPFVESMNGEVHQGFEAVQPSAQGNSPWAHPGNDAHRAAILNDVTIPNYLARFVRHIAREFNRDFHEAVHGRPVDALRRGLERFPVRTWLGTPEELLAECRIDFGHRLVTHNGVSVDDHFFRDPPVRDASETQEDRPFTVPYGVRPDVLKRLRAAQADAQRRRLAAGGEWSGFEIRGRGDDARWIEVCDEHGERLGVLVCHTCEAMGRPVPRWEVIEVHKVELERSREAEHRADRRRLGAQPATPRRRMPPKGGRTTAEAVRAQRGARADAHAPSIDHPYAVPTPAKRQAAAPSRRRRGRALPVTQV